MRKSERILYTVFKVIYAVCTVAVVATYLREMFDPTAAHPLVTSNAWLTLGYMSCVFVLITEREKKFEGVTVEDN